MKITLSTPSKIFLVADFKILLNALSKKFFVVV